MGRLQQIDAWVLRQLHENVRQMQQSAPSGRGEAQQSAASASPPGYQTISSGESEVIALQIAPWTFLTSGYAWGLLCIAILLNRIQHIVTPPRQMSRNAGTGSRSWQMMSAITSALVPIDLSSTFTRACIRLPSVYLLLRALVLMASILLQSVDMFPSWSILQSLGTWSSHMDMPKACWITFNAVCASLIVAAFMRGLEGSPSPSSTFNLPQYAFMLHIYSSPYTNIFGTQVDPLSGSKLPKRPSPHVLVTLILPLFQIALLHAQGIWKSRSRKVLIPTSICGIIALVHFNYVLYKRALLEYPYVLLVPSILENFFLVIILLTTFLNALTQVLLQGSITRPLFGVGAGTFPTEEEEFAVALLRLGTSGLEATSIAGLGNEMATVRSSQDHGVYVNLTPHGALVFSPEAGSLAGNRQAPNGFAKEVRKVRIKSAEGELWFSLTWMRELKRFFGALLALFRGAWRKIRGRSLDANRPQGSESADSESAWRNTENQGVDVNDERLALYRRFLRGTSISDDEDDEYHAVEDRADSQLSSRDDTENDEEEEDKDEEAETDNLSTDQRAQSVFSEDMVEDAGGLYAEHAVPTRARSSSRAFTPIAPVLLAHLTTQEGQPLTRRRYSQLTSPRVHPHQSRPAQPALAHHGAHNSGEDAEPRRLCVICMSSERVIICWPCRCLSMCDDCRANLASRNPSTKHSCPCCRQSVEGFSRIFIP